MKTALTIAGSDSSGGAGIQADIKTMTVLGVYAMSAITALTAQNTVGVDAISEVSPQFLGQQLDCIFEDIYPDAVKIGMISSAELIKTAADRLKKYNAKNIVVDPVMVSTSGANLIENNAAKFLQEELFPLADIITPNIPEAEALSGMIITNQNEMRTAAVMLSQKFKCSVLVKGGHLSGSAYDVLCTNQGKIVWYCCKRIHNSNTHGSGCTLSSAIAAFLAKGYDIFKAVAYAKSYLGGAIAFGLNLGKGSGPMAHNYNMIRKGI